MYYFDLGKYIPKFRATPLGRSPAAEGQPRALPWALLRTHQAWLERIYAVEIAVGAIVEEAPHVVKAVTGIAVADAVEIFPRM
jgi:hypothetical protein